MPGFLDWSRITGGMLPGKLGDWAVQRDEFVRFEVTLQIRIAGRRGSAVLQCSCVQSNPVLTPNGSESQHYVKSRNRLLHCRREGRKGIPVFGIVAPDVARGATDTQAANVLVAIGLWQWNPKMGWATGICISGNMHLIREFKRARGHRSARFRGSRMAPMDGNNGKHY